MKNTEKYRGEMRVREGGREGEGRKLNDGMFRGETKGKV